jgi:hypothetical protein
MSVRFPVAAPLRVAEVESMIQLPPSMASELATWNDGRGIDLECWIGCCGGFDLAVGYTTLFWPNFVLFEDYILREGFSVESLRGFEKSCKDKKSGVEWVMNHLHIADVHTGDQANATEDKMVFLGKTLKEIYEAKLRWQFPERPCVVEFYEPDDKKNLVEYQLSFWQKAHEISS